MTKIQKYSHRTLLIGAILTLSSCTVGPDFKRPFFKTQTQKAFINAPEKDKSKKNQIMSKWWTRINDPLLNRYVDQLLNGNLKLVEAAERITQAQERLGINRSAYFPTINANADAGRSFSPNALTNQRTYSNSYETSINTSWQVDLFGKIARTVEAADANYIASIYDREALTHSLIAQLLNVRAEIATNKHLLTLAQQNVENRQSTLELVERRYKSGVNLTGLQDVLRAKNNVTSVKADEHRYNRFLADATYRLDTLLGYPPGTTNPLTTEFPLIAPPVDAPICVPASLLDRRPDLRAQELRIKAANADIGVAIADLYPSMNITGALGLSATSTNNLFNADRLVGSLLSSITSRIFEGGALRANIRIQKSEARELAANYADNLLNAMREVETNLKAEHELEQEIKSAQDSVDALSKVEKIMQDRYEQGLESLQDVLDAKRDLYLAQQNLLITRQEKWNARTALYLALGGDWFGNNKQHDNCMTRIEKL